MSDSTGLSCTGTFRCNSTFAAADDVIELGAGGGPAGGNEPVVTLPVPLALGMVMVSPQEGQSICESLRFGLVHRQLLLAVRTIKYDVHSQ